MNPKHKDEMVPKLETEGQKKDRIEKEMIAQNAIREKTGYSFDWEKVKSSSIGSENGTFALGTEEYKWTYKFSVRMECQLAENELVPIVLRYRHVSWKLSDALKGEAQSDAKGIIFFTATTATEENFSRVEFEFKKTKLTVPVSAQGMTLLVPKELCGG